MDQVKICKYCFQPFYKKDFLKQFPRMITCGSLNCKRKLKNDWTYSKKCSDCGQLITTSAQKCKKCSTTGVNNPFYGKTHTENTKKKIPLYKPNTIPYMKGRHHTFESKMKNSIAHQTGDIIQPLHFGNNLGNAVRHSELYLTWRKAVYERDKFTCCNDKCCKRGVALEAHHVIPFVRLVNEAIKQKPLLNAYEACLLYGPLWDIENGQTLCKSCHAKLKKYKNK